jgi:type II secretory pathway pseudopilin PulG
MEMLVGLAIMALTTAIVLPDLAAANRRLAMKTAVLRMTYLFMSVRSRAAGSNRYTAIRFTQSNDQWMYSVYEDTNGNGVSTQEIASGVDVLIDGPVAVQQQTAMATVGFLPGGDPDPDTGHPMNPGALPVQFGTARLCSFAPLDGATPGTIYLTDGAMAAAIRSSGDGEVYAMWLDRKSGKWSQ